MEQFKTALESVLGDEWKVSGVAEVHSLSPPLLRYSASLYNPEASGDGGDIDHLVAYNKHFSQLSVPGFTHHETTLLTFNTNLPVPLPPWRVQCLYLAKD